MAAPHIRMAAPHIRYAATRRELESARDDFITQGYEVLEEGEATTRLRKSTWGSVGIHVLVALLTARWTIGIGNLVYAVIAHLTAEQDMIKLDAPAELPAPTAPPASA
jgi:hypothetical protein